jgi:hypothetical protein
MSWFFSIPDLKWLLRFGQDCVLSHPFELINVPTILHCVVLAADIMIKGTKNKQMCSYFTYITWYKILRPPWDSPRLIFDGYCVPFPRVKGLGR